MGIWLNIWYTVYGQHKDSKQETNILKKTLCKYWLVKEQTKKRWNIS